MLLQSFQRSSRSTSKRRQFVTDVSSEDTPLSMRHTSKSEGSSRKRLVLYQEEPSKEAEPRLNSTEERLEEERNTGRGQRQYSSVGESETEKQDEHHDGVRRSQRTRKFMYASYNDSWIFGEKTAKVKL